MQATRDASYARDLRRYRALALWIPLFFIVYFAFILGVESKPGREEVFPIASWSLFSMVPNEDVDFTLRIHAVDGVPLSKPLYFGESVAIFPQAASHLAHNAIHRLGKAVESGDPESAELRRRFEELYFAPFAKRVAYDVVTRKFDVLVRWKTGAFIDVRTLADFEMVRP